MASSSPSYAFVTLLTSDSYLPGALTLVAALRDVHTNSPNPPFRTACVVTPETISVETRRAVLQAFDIVIGVDVIREDTKKGLDLLGRPDLHLVLTKLHVFRLTQFDKIIFLDADILPIRPISHLFNLPHEFSAVPDVGWPDIFNSGFMAFKPGEEKFSAIMELVRAKGSWDGGDQGILNEWRGNDWNRLSFTYNTTPTAAYTYAPAYERFGSEIRAIHFIGTEKPWKNLSWRAPGSASSAAGPHLAQTISSSLVQPSYGYSALIDKWFSVYDAHYRPAVPSAAQKRDTEQRRTVDIPRYEAAWDGPHRKQEQHAEEHGKGKGAPEEQERQGGATKSLDELKSLGLGGLENALAQSGFQPSMGTDVVTAMASVATTAMPDMGLGYVGPASEKGEAQYIPMPLDPQRFSQTIEEHHHHLQGGEGEVVYAYRYVPGPSEPPPLPLQLQDNFGKFVEPETWAPPATATSEPPPHLFRPKPQPVISQSSEDDGKARRAWWWGGQPQVSQPGPSGQSGQFGGSPSSPKYGVPSAPGQQQQRQRQGPPEPQRVPFSGQISLSASSSQPHTAQPHTHNQRPPQHHHQQQQHYHRHFHHPTHSPLNDGRGASRGRQPRRQSSPPPGWHGLPPSFEEVAEESEVELPPGAWPDERRTSPPRHEHREEHRVAEHQQPEYAQPGEHHERFIQEVPRPEPVRSLSPERPKSPPLVTWNPAIEPPPDTIPFDALKHPLPPPLRNVWDIPHHQPHHRPPPQQHQPQAHQQHHQPRQPQHQVQSQGPVHARPPPRHHPQGHHPSRIFHGHSTSEPSPTPPPRESPREAYPEAFFQEPPPSIIPKHLIQQGHYANVTSANPEPDRSKVNPVFPWESKPRPTPGRVFPRSDRSPPRSPPRRELAPVATTLPLIPQRRMSRSTVMSPVSATVVASPTTAGSPQQRSPSPVPRGVARAFSYDWRTEQQSSPPIDYTGRAGYTPAWDNVPSIQRYATKLVAPHSLPGQAPPPKSERKPDPNEAPWIERVDPSDASSHEADDEEDESDLEVYAGSGANTPSAKGGHRRKGSGVTSPPRGPGRRPPPIKVDKGVATEESGKGIGTPKYRSIAIQTIPKSTQSRAVQVNRPPYTRAFRSTSSSPTNEQPPGPQPFAPPPVKPPITIAPPVQPTRSSFKPRVSSVVFAPTPPTMPEPNVSPPGGRSPQRIISPRMGDAPFSVMSLRDGRPPNVGLAPSPTITTPAAAEHHTSPFHQRSSSYSGASGRGSGFSTTSTKRDSTFTDTHTTPRSSVNLTNEPIPGLPFPSVINPHVRTSSNETGPTVSTPPSSGGPASPADENAPPKPKKAPAGRRWDSRRDVDVFKSQSQDVLARFLSMSTWEEGKQPQQQGSPTVQSQSPVVQQQSPPVP